MVRALIVLLALAFGCDDQQPAVDRTPTPIATTPTPVTPVTRKPLVLDAIDDRQERAAILEVVDVIDAGRKPAYRKDGATFENRERRLPKQALGYYHEYTVKTPGETDRGARRLVLGDRHELFYTRDHYKSFIEVRAPD